MSPRRTGFALLFRSAWVGTAGLGAALLACPWPASAVLGTAALALACDKAPQAPMTAAEFQSNAEQAYNKALQKFFAGDYLAAITVMEDVKREFPGTRVARLAQLRIADSHYHQDAFPEAITSYREFLRDFPSDEEVPYARYRVILCLFESRGESITAPPLEERDLANIRDADRAIVDFQRDYPDYKENERIRYMQLWVRGMLARHDLYVARYYLERQNWDAALSRAEYALATYRDTGLEPEALVLVGETHLRRGNSAEARAAFEAVLERYPKSPFCEPSRKFLAFIDDSSSP
jgi:outer membrane protein assembly factor BamD